MNKALYVFLMLYLLCCHHNYAQKGDYFVTHLSPGSDKIDNVNFDIVQDQNGIICIANRSGVLQFDGNTWEMIQSPAAIFAITVDSANNIYVGGRKGFGKLVRDEMFNLSYKSLSALYQDPIDIFDIEVMGNNLYALNEERMFVHSLKASSSSFVVGRENAGSLYGLHKIDNQIIVSTEKKGLLKLVGEKLVRSDIQVPSNLPVVFSAKNKEGTAYLLGTEDNGLYLYKQNQVSVFKVDDKGYLKGSDIVNAVWLSDKLIAISTLKGGVVFVNPTDGTVEQIINYHTGLPDNEVFALATDKDSGLWVAHEYGFSRISPNLPFRSFSRFPGLEGNLLAVQQNDERFYVATSLGVYYLDEVKNYKDVIYYVKKMPLSAGDRGRSKEQKQKTKDGKQEPSALKKERRGFFSFLKRKKKRGQHEVIRADAGGNDKDGNLLKKLFSGKKTTLPTYETKIKRELQSVKYVYKQVKGIEAKTSQLVVLGDKLVASGLGGAFEVKDSISIKITDRPVRYLYASSELNMIFACTYENEVLVYKMEGDKWLAKDFIEGFKEQIQHISEDGKHIWLCGTDYIYKMELSSLQAKVVIEEYAFTNPYFEETYAVSHKSTVYFINSSGYYFYDKKANAIRQVDNSEDPVLIKPEKYLESPDSRLWVYDGNDWQCYGGSSKQPQNLKILNLFKEIGYITFDPGSETFWVIAANNELYKISDEPLPKLISNFNLYLKEIRIPSKRIQPEKKFKVNQKESSLTFEFVQPDFSGILGVEYKYKLEGLNDSWSVWSANNNIVNFPYLPPGKYKLEVKTRNVFGQETEIDPISFKVVPPYWRLPWFYALEVILFGVLLFLSFRLNRRNNRNRLISRLLAFLTLILVVEFIQTVAESRFQTDSSPVIDFFIQVSVALMVLPIEGVLIKFFFKGKTPLPNGRALKRKLSSDKAKLK